MLKADKKIVNEIIENLRSKVSDFNHRIEYYLKRLEKAETVEEVMEIKQQILALWVFYIPLRGDTCYFCIKCRDVLDVNCDSCEYAKHHGNCAEKDSSWRKINSLRWKLHDLINEEYYKGESYEQEADK